MFNNKNVYQIYPLTFFDSNKDGIGDLKGIINQIEYISELKIDYIWICPVTESPMVDNGYDVANYKKINPLLGTNKDYEELISAFQKKNIGVIFDLVMNHTSNKHEWFKKSVKRIKPYDQYYVWRKKPVEGFASQFENNSWTYVRERGEYYLHQFSSGQPDLNWENPMVMEEFRKILKYWIKKGVKGFRFDVVDMIGKQVDKGIKINVQRTMQLLKKLGKNTFIDKDIFTVGECWSVSLDDQAKYTSYPKPILNTIFNAKYMFLNENQSKYIQKPLNQKVFKEYKGWLSKQNRILSNANALLPLFFENHDFARSVSRIWSGDKDLEKKAKILAATHLLRKGISFVYQGQELGLHNATYDSSLKINDVETHKFVKNNKNKKDLLKCVKYGTRDNARKPFPWHKGVYNKIIPFYKYRKKYFVKNQKKNKNSVLNFYKFLLNLKQQKKELFSKGNVTNNKWNKNNFLMSHTITFRQEKIIVISNWFQKGQKVKIEKVESNILYSHGFKKNHLKPYGLIIFAIKKKTK